MAICLGLALWAKCLLRTLWSDLAAAGVSFLPAQIKQNVVNAVDANPSAFGITNTTTPPAGPFTISNPYNAANGGADVNPIPSSISVSWALYATQMVSTTAGQTYLWADDEHFSAAGQQIEANYLYSLIQNAAPAVSETLTASGEVASNSSATFIYQWESLAPGQTTWNNIAGATGSTYVVQQSDQGSELRVQVSYTDNTDQTTTVLSQATPAVVNTATVTPASVQQEIAGLYVTLYGLAATQTGITYWTNVVSAFDSSITAANAGSTAISGADEVYLGQQMTAGSPVVNGTTYFQTVYPSTMTDLAYVQALYQNMSGFIGTTAGDQYWLAVLQQSEAGNGGNVTLAREAIVGQFTHDFYGNNLTVGAAALGVSASDYALLVAGQQTLRNKATVAQYWATETGVSGGAILNFTSVTDPSFAAAQHVLAGITSDPNTVTVAIIGIAAAVAHQDLSLV